MNDRWNPAFAVLIIWSMRSEVKIYAGSGAGLDVLTEVGYSKSASFNCDSLCRPLWVAFSTISRIWNVFRLTREIF